VPLLVFYLLSYVWGEDLEDVHITILIHERPRGRWKKARWKSYLQGETMVELPIKVVDDEHAFRCAWHLGKEEAKFKTRLPVV
jgi:hypothetical protein